VANQTIKLKQKRSQDRRNRIIVAATRLFGRRGISATSLTDVAKAAKVPLPSLYDYFADKDDLVAAVPEENYLALYRQLLAEDDNRDPRRRLRTLYVGNLKYIDANPDWGRVFFLEIWPSAAIAHGRIRRAVDLYGLRYVELIRDAVAAGAYRRDLDPYLAMSALMGGMCQLAAVWLLYRKPYDLVERGSALFALLEKSFVQRSPDDGAAIRYPKLITANRP